MTTEELVTRLRKAADEAMWPAPQHAAQTLYALAADEIERLNSEVARHKNRLMRISDAIKDYLT